MTSTIDSLNSLKALLDENMITQAEFDQLKAQLLATPAMGSTSRPFSVPSQPLGNRVVFRNPHTGQTVEVKRGAAFWLTFFFGCIYLAYKEAWLHAGINLILAILTAGIFFLPLSMFIYPFFAYRIIVDSYRRKGWIEINPTTAPPPVPPAPAASVI